MIRPFSLALPVPVPDSESTVDGSADSSESTAATSIIPSESSPGYSSQTVPCIAGLGINCRSLAMTKLRGWKSSAHRLGERSLDKYVTVSSDSRALSRERPCGCRTAGTIPLLGSVLVT
jgi:hypothetical protein